MKIGLFGFPGVGKTTLFNALTGAEAPVTGARREAHVGVVRVPDPRLERLSEMYKPKKTTPASVDFVDLVGFQRDDANASFDIEALKTVDALAHVVRAFDGELPHSEGELDPARDVATMETELILADHTVLDKRAVRLRDLKQKRGLDGEEKAESILMERCLEHLGDDRPLRLMELSEDEQRLLRGYGLLSARPLLIVVNVGEDQVDKIADPQGSFQLQDAAASAEVEVCAASAQIEMEISRLSDDDMASFMEDLGLTEPARHRIIRAAYGLLGLESFFTVGEDECRAWTIRKGTPARQAAGVIHSDLERGFIRAEVVGYDDLMECGSLPKAREKGVLRLEGKEYPVADGEIVHVRFNV
jgi:GTP-binding protein YchF